MGAQNTGLLLFLWILFSGSCSTPEAMDDRPNMLWITCEDISPNLGIYGDSTVITPNLDRLAKRGVWYTNAFASAPVCAVARSGIITGMYATSLGSQHMRCKGKFPDTLKTYPAYLRQAGYYCTNNRKTDYNLDFDYDSIWDASSNKAHWKNRPHPNQPFFAIFNFTGTHESRVNRLDRHLTQIQDLPESYKLGPEAVSLPPYFPQADSVRELWTRYYNNIIAFDQKVGALLHELEEDGLAENTIVFFYSDHGAGVPRHKRWMYDSGLQVPLIVYAPERFQHLLPHPVGAATDELVSFVDLAPTALHVAGITVPENMEGRPFLGSDLTPERDYIYATRDRMDERYDMQRAVRDKTYKYIRYYEAYKPFCQYMNTPEKGAIMQAIRTAHQEGTLPAAGQHMMADNKPKEELFYIPDDPYELNNLATDPKYQEKLEEVRQAHNQWSARTMDTGLIPEPILRAWEAQYNSNIYEIMRAEQIPVEAIRETALGNRTDEALIADLTHDNDAVRYWAAIQLGNRASQIKPIKALIPLLEDRDPTVSVAAARAICLMGSSTQGIPVLAKMLDHPDPWTRLQAAIVLDELDEMARPAISALQSVMADENKYVVRVANRALNQLLGESNVVP